MFGSLVPDQQGTFESEHFLSVLKNKSKIRYMLFEHARIEERRSSFREDIEKREISITFEDVGINTPGVSLSKVTETQNEIHFESNPLIFSGVSVVINGHISLEDLTGYVKMDLSGDSPELADSMYALSEDEKNFLRTRGLPIP
ncbi:unnamed protein product [Auanema sp. JU1783]|nr:unnamed protein product [Auanema sp. JU1783]